MLALVTAVLYILVLAYSIILVVPEDTAPIKYAFSIPDMGALDPLESVADVILANPYPLL